MGIRSLVWAVITSVWPCYLAAAADWPAGGVWVRDLQGQMAQVQGQWYFHPDQNQVSGPQVLQLQSRVQLLPSGVIEQLADMSGPQSRIACRLCGLLETYRGGQYLLVTRWDGPQDANAATSSAADLAGPNMVDPLAIPQQLIRRLSSYPGSTGRRVGAGPDLTALADLVGGLVYARAGVYLVTAPLGIDARASVYELLPCRNLEAMEAMQARSGRPLRFNVSGLLVRYRGRGYLLVRRVFLEHLYGNLGI